MKEKAWPRVIRQGSVGVKIYRVENRGYVHHVISYYLGKSRVRKVVADFPKAKKEAERIATQLSKGEKEALKLTGADSTAYVHAQKLLQPLGVPLLAAVEEYVSAKKLGVPLLVAAKQYATRQKTIVARKSVSEIKEEFIQAKTVDGMSVRYLADCRSRLQRFTRDVNADIASIDSANPLSSTSGVHNHP